MNDPIVFISRNRVKEGLLDDFKKHYQESIPATDAAKPGTLVQLAYVSEDAREVVIVRLFPNAEGSLRSSWTVRLAPILLVVGLMAFGAFRLVSLVY